MDCNLVAGVYAAVYRGLEHGCVVWGCDDGNFDTVTRGEEESDVYEGNKVARSEVGEEDNMDVMVL